MRHDNWCTCTHHTISTMEGVNWEVEGTCDGHALATFSPAPLEKTPPKTSLATVGATADRLTPDSPEAWEVRTRAHPLMSCTVDELVKKAEAAVELEEAGVYQPLDWSGLTAIPQAAPAPTPALPDPHPHVVDRAVVLTWTKTAAAIRVTVLALAALFVSVWNTLGELTRRRAHYGLIMAAIGGLLTSANLNSWWPMLPFMITFVTLCWTDRRRQRNDNEIHLKRVAGWRTPCRCRVCGQYERKHGHRYGTPMTFGMRGLP